MEKLIEADELAVTRRRHAQHFRDRLGHAYDDWLRMSDRAWRSLYEPELDNLRAALDWALGPDGDGAIAIAIAGASGAMWADFSLPGEGRRWLASAGARIDAETPASDQALLSLWTGLLRRYSAPAEAVAALERASNLFRRAGNPAGLGHSLARRGAILARLGRFDDATLALSQAFAALKDSGLPKAQAFYYSENGTMKMMAGELSEARTSYHESARLYRSMGAETAALAILGNIGDLTWAMGDLDAALAAFSETVPLLRKSPVARKDILGNNLMNLAGVQVERGELAEALTAAREGLPLLLEGGYAWNMLDHLALRAALVGKHASAASLAGFTDATYKAKETARQPNEARVRERLQGFLAGHFAHHDLERLFADGAKMSEEEACRVALEE